MKVIYRGDIVKMLKENIGFLYTIYEPSFYVKSYLIQFLGLVIIKSCNSYNELFEGAVSPFL